MLIIACTLCAPLVAQNVQRFSSVNPAWFGYTAKDVELHASTEIQGTLAENRGSHPLPP